MNPNTQQFIEPAVGGMPAAVKALLDKWEARSRDALPTDAMLINKHVRELQEVLARFGTQPPPRTSGYISDARTPREPRLEWDDDSCRAKFETLLTPDFDLEHWGGEYFHGKTAFAWLVWKAGVKAARAGAAS